MTEEEIIFKTKSEPKTKAKSYYALDDTYIPIISKIKKDYSFRGMDLKSIDVIRLLAKSGAVNAITNRSAFLKTLEYDWNELNILTL
jgi:hypothetical protein